MDKHAFKRRKLEHPPVQAEENTVESDDSPLDSMAALDSGEEEIPKTNGTSGVGMKKARPARTTSKPVVSGDMYSSDLFQIQVGELLSTVQPNYDEQTARVEKTLRKLKQVIEGIAPREALPVHVPAYPSAHFH